MRTSKQSLIDAGVQIIRNEDAVGGWDIYQTRTDCNKRWRTKRPILNLCTKHPYGVDKYYPGTTIHIGGRNRCFTIHQIVWIMNFDNYPEGCDISHKDDDPYNNDLENLECVSHKENIQKRKCNGANQNINSKNWEKK